MIVGRMATRTLGKKLNSMFVPTGATILSGVYFKPPEPTVTLMVDPAWAETAAAERATMLKRVFARCILEIYFSKRKKIKK